MVRLYCWWLFSCARSAIAYTSAHKETQERAVKRERNIMKKGGMVREAKLHDRKYCATRVKRQTLFHWMGEVKSVQFTRAKNTRTRRRRRRNCIVNDLFCSASLTRFWAQGNTIPLTSWLFGHCRQDKKRERSRLYNWTCQRGALWFRTSVNG